MDRSVVIVRLAPDNILNFNEIDTVQRWQGYFFEAVSVLSKTSNLRVYLRNLYLIIDSGTGLYQHFRFTRLSRLSKHLERERLELGNLVHKAGSENYL